MKSSLYCSLGISMLFLLALFGCGSTAKPANPGSVVVAGASTPPMNDGNDNTGYQGRKLGCEYRNYMRSEVHLNLRVCYSYLTPEEEKSAIDTIRNSFDSSSSYGELYDVSKLLIYQGWEQLDNISKFDNYDVLLDLGRYDLTADIVSVNFHTGGYSQTSSYERTAIYSSKLVAVKLALKQVDANFPDYLNQWKGINKPSDSMGGL